MRMKPGKLTQKQELFIAEYLNTGNASAAYKTAYNAENMKAETINRAAFDLINNSKISARIAELQAQAAKAATVTLAGHLTSLQELRDMAMERGQFSAAISAEIARGKASGLYTEKKQVELAGEVAYPKDVEIYLVSPDGTRRKAGAANAETETE